MTRHEFETNLILLGWQKENANGWSQDDYVLDTSNPYHVTIMLKAGAASRIYSVGTYYMAMEKLKNANVYPKELSGA